MSEVNLRRLLVLDGVTCIAMGLVLILAAEPLAKLFALPHNLLFYAGLLLFPCAALMLAIAGRTHPPKAMVWVVIAGNALWVMASLVAGLILFAPSAMGLAFVLLQAAVVAIFLVYERRGLKVAMRQTA